eukprot:7141890-Alexandrium_andersonii.AAC.1
MWHEHFVHKLGADDLEYGELVQDHVRHSADKMQVDTQSGHVPSRAFIVGKCARMDARRKWGPDLISPGALRIAPEASASILQPIMAKAVLATGEPLAWKGGRLAPIPKGNASSAMSACRG